MSWVHNYFWKFMETFSHTHSCVTSSIASFCNLHQQCLCPSDFPSAYRCSKYYLFTLFGHSSIFHSFYFSVHKLVIYLDAHMISISLIYIFLVNQNFRFTIKQLLLKKPMVRSWERSFPVHTGLHPPVLSILRPCFLIWQTDSPQSVISLHLLCT